MPRELPAPLPPLVGDVPGLGFVLGWPPGTSVPATVPVAPTAPPARRQPVAPQAPGQQKEPQQVGSVAEQ